MFLVPITRRSATLSRGFDRFFDDGFERFFAPAAQVAADDTPRSPALDVRESEQAYTVTLDMPGVAKEDVKVSIDGRHVSIEAKARKQEDVKDGDRIVYRERSICSYARTFKVASDIDQAESGAKLENGVLTLSLRKRGVASAAQISVN
jgi:HSP20 family protein